MELQKEEFSEDSFYLKEKNQTSTFKMTVGHGSDLTCPLTFQLSIWGDLFLPSQN